MEQAWLNEKNTLAQQQHALYMALSQSNWERAQTEGSNFEASFGLFQQQYGHLRDSDRALDTFITQGVQLLARYHAEAPRLEREHAAQTAIGQFKNDNLLWFTQRAINSKNLDDMEKYGLPFTAKAQAFLFENQKYDDIPFMASTLNEVRKTLESFQEKYPLLVQEEEVRKDIAAIKATSNMHYLEMGLNQKNVEQIYTYGPKFEQLFDTFQAKHGNSSVNEAKQFSNQAQDLLKRFRTEGPQLQHDRKIDDEISQIKAKNYMHFLLQALAQKNSAQVAKYGPLFEKQFEQFLAVHGCDERAYRFVVEGKSLLEKYHTEGPVIQWEETVRQKISAIRSENNVHYLSIGINQRNPEYITTHGPKVEQQLADFIASCGSNPTREYNNFLNELKLLVERYNANGPDIIREHEVRQAIQEFKSKNTIHFLSMALSQRNADQLDQYGDRFVEEYKAFLEVYENEKHAAAFIKEIKSLYTKYEKEESHIRREREVGQAISAFKSSNHMHFLSIAINQRNESQVEIHGPPFERDLTDFLAKYSEDKTAQSFIREAKSLLEKYKVEGPRIKREEEVRQAINALKNTNHIHFLSIALNQRNASEVRNHGPKLKELFDEFLPLYNKDADAANFIRDTKNLLARYEKEGPDIERQEEVTSAISEFKSNNEIHYLSMALNQKNAESVKQYGPRLEERFQGFLALYNGEKYALAFIKEVQALLNKYHQEGPKIIRRTEVEDEIRRIKSQHNMQYLSNALTQKNIEKIEEHGHIFEDQFSQFMAQYGQDAPAQSFIQEAKKLIARFHEVCPPAPIPSTPTFVTAGINPYSYNPSAFSPSAPPYYSGYGSVPMPLSAPAPYPAAPIGLVTTPPASAPVQHMRPAVPTYGLPPTPAAAPSSSCSDPGCAPPSLSCCAADSQVAQPSAPVQESPYYSGQQFPQQTYPSAYPSSQYADASQYFSIPQHMQLHQQPTFASPNPQEVSYSQKPADWQPPSSPSPVPSPAPSPASENQQSVPAAPHTPALQSNGDGYFSIPANAPAPFTDAEVAKAEGEGENQQTVTAEEKAKEKFREIRYEELQIISKIGSGSYGTVYKAWWRGTVVAVKKLDDSTEMTPAMVELFRKEAAAMALLSHHPSLSNFVGACCEPPNVCLVSQYYRFGSLESVLRGPNRSALPWKAFVKIAKETAAGIYHLHKEGVLHSRIASRNILIGDGCRAYVNDFAFCHFKPKEQVYAQSATQTFLGPVRYMSPEAMMHKYSEGSDAWAFGVLLWELWEKKEPFEGEDELTVAFKVAQDKQTLPISPSVPEVIAKLIQSCWQERASQRPPFNEIVDTLELYFASLKK